MLGGRAFVPWKSLKICWNLGIMNITEIFAPETTSKNAKAIQSPVVRLLVSTSDEGFAIWENFMEFRKFVNPPALVSATTLSTQR